MFFQCFRAVATYKRYKFLTFENHEKWRKKKKVKFSGNFVPCVTSSVLENFWKFFQNFRKMSKNIEKCHFFGFFQKPKFPGGHFGVSRL